MAKDKNINVRPDVPKKADELAKLLSAECGYPVSRTDAIRTAVDEALEKRRVKS